MLKPLLVLFALFAAFFTQGAAKEPAKVLATGLYNAESVAVSADGKIYVTTAGEPGKNGDGSVVMVDQGEATPVVTGLDDPHGIVAYQQWLFVADKQKVWRIKGKEKTEFVSASAFPSPPQFLNDIVADPESGILYVSDTGDLKGRGGAIYKITPQGKVSLVIDAKKLPPMHSPDGLAMDGASHLLMVDYGNSTLFRIKVADGSSELIADGLGGVNGLTWDHHGRLFISDWNQGRLFAIPRPGDKPIEMSEKFQSADDLCLDPIRKRILVVDMKAGTLSAIPITIPGAEVDETPLPIEGAVAFPDLQWSGWKGETDSGKIVPLRPIVLTHAADGSNRVFVATQHGVIHAFANPPSPPLGKGGNNTTPPLTKGGRGGVTTVFLDLQDRVKYNDATNEEGFLGLAFHPRFKDNGEFFVFYTLKNAKLTNIVSRFRVSKSDPNRAEPASEEEILRFTKPYWNHDGGTIGFGPDGCLYVTHGDGGLANDPHGNGQKLNTLLGKVLRIDVDRKEDGKNYAIPKDNPFVGQTDARPEIWAYGLRNVWRMAFDRKTGRLWAGEVGQNLYEEINLITRGGNYGWNRRESLHPFSSKGTGVRPEFIDPIWEYHHDIGKSITGGTVYRGSRLPELQGAYLYADYVSGKIWALTYDEAKRRVTANRPIKDRGHPILSFGEDEQGEVYYLIATASGQGIYRFVKVADR